MDHTAAVTALIAKLRAIGYADDEFKCEYSKDEIKVTILRVPNSYTKLEILITDMWAYPNESCYFVNFSNSANGNFSAASGTPSIDTAIFDLGQAVWFAQSSPAKDRKRPYGVQVTTDDAAGNGHTCNYVVLATSAAEAIEFAGEAYPDATDLSVCDLKELIAFQYDGMAQLVV
jgi:hypothetical protein